MRDIWMVPLSGGLDSTYMLWKMLQEGKHVVPFHVSFSKDADRSEMWLFDFKAFVAITKLLKLDYPTFEEVNVMDIHHHYIGDVGRDTEGILLGAQKLAYSLLRAISPEEQVSIKLVEGVVTDDMETEEFRLRHEDAIDQSLWAALVNGMMHRINRRKVAKVDKTIYYPLLKDGVRKSDIINELPNELYRNVWWCRSPEGTEPCNKCLSCTVHAKALIEAERKQ